MFLSLPFIILFTCCLILYYTVKGNYQKPVLLLASCIFIGYFNIAYLVDSRTHCGNHLLLGTLDRDAGARK